MYELVFVETSLLNFDCFKDFPLESLLTMVEINWHVESTSGMVCLRLLVSLESRSETCYAWMMN